MFEPKVRLSIETSPGEWSHTEFKIDAMTATDIFRKVDYPKDRSDYLDNMLCTPQRIREEVIEKRREAARIISEMLIKQLIYHMSKNDTKMGYPMDE